MSDLLDAGTEEEASAPLIPPQISVSSTARKLSHEEDSTAMTACLSPEKHESPEMVKRVFTGETAASGALIGEKQDWTVSHRLQVLELSKISEKFLEGSEPSYPSGKEIFKTAEKFPPSSNQEETSKAIDRGQETVSETAATSPPEVAGLKEGKAAKAQRNMSLADTEKLILDLMNIAVARSYEGKPVRSTLAAVDTVADSLSYSQIISASSVTGCRFQPENSTKMRPCHSCPEKLESPEILKKFFAGEAAASVSTNQQETSKPIDKGQETELEMAVTLAPEVAGGQRPLTEGKAAKAQSSQSCVADTGKLMSSKTCPKLLDLNRAVVIRCNGGVVHPTSLESYSMVEEAWKKQLKSSYSVGTLLAAMDTSTADAMNYNQVLVSEFVLGGSASLMKEPAESEIVMKFLLNPLQLQGWQKTVYRYILGESVLLESFRFDSNKGRENLCQATKTLLMDLGASAIGRVATVDHALADLRKVKKGMTLILNICVCVTSPTLLSAEGCSMIDRMTIVNGTASACLSDYAAKSQSNESRDEGEKLISIRTCLESFNMVKAGASKKLKGSYVYYKGRTVGIVAAMDTTTEAMNYNLEPAANGFHGRGTRQIPRPIPPLVNGLQNAQDRGAKEGGRGGGYGGRNLFHWDDYRFFSIKLAVVHPNGFRKWIAVMDKRAFLTIDGFCVWVHQQWADRQLFRHPARVLDRQNLWPGHVLRFYDRNRAEIHTDLSEISTNWQFEVFLGALRYIDAEVQPLAQVHQKAEILLYMLLDFLMHH